VEIQDMSSTLARIFGRFRGIPLPDSLVGKAVPLDQPAPLPPGHIAVPRSVAAQGLFIIGAARTGTTVLQNALNDSPDIFLFGEPAFHRDPGSTDFAERYNSKHRAWGNQETKSSYCPLLFEGDASWHEYLAHMATLHRYVGSKIVITPGGAHAEVEKVHAFQSRHFYRSRYVFTFRNPLDVLMSTRDLAQFNGGEMASHVDVLRTFFEVLALYIRALRNLPHVHAIFHESVDDQAFAALEQAWSIALPGAARYYDNRKVRRHTLDDVPKAHQATVVEAIAIYEDFQQAALTGFDLLQIEQNNGHLHPDHFTVLGRLSLPVSRFLEGLEGQPA